MKLTKLFIVLFALSAQGAFAADAVQFSPNSVVSGKVQAFINKMVSARCAATLSTRGLQVVAEEKQEVRMDQDFDTYFSVTLETVFNGNEDAEQILIEVLDAAVSNPSIPNPTIESFEYTGSICD